MKGLTVTILLWLATFAGISQLAFEWESVFENTRPIDLHVDDMGNAYIIANYDGGSGRALRIQKVTTAGEPDWTYDYSSPLWPWSEWYTAKILKNNRGDIVFAASQPGKIVVGKLSKNGDELWRIDSLDIGTSVGGLEISISASDQIFLLQADNRSIESRSKLVKIDSDGQLVWTRSLSEDMDNSRFSAIEQLSLGRVIVSGNVNLSEYQGNIAGGKPAIVTYDSHGDILWQH